MIRLHTIKSQQGKPLDWVWKELNLNQPTLFLTGSRRAMRQVLESVPGIGTGKMLPEKAHRLLTLRTMVLRAYSTSYSQVVVVTHDSLFDPTFVGPALRKMVRAAKIKGHRLDVYHVVANNKCDSYMKEIAEVVGFHLD